MPSRSQGPPLGAALQRHARTAHPRQPDATRVPEHNMPLAKSYHAEAYPAGVNRASDREMILLWLLRVNVVCCKKAVWPVIVGWRKCAKLRQSRCAHWGYLNNLHAVSARSFPTQTS